MVLPFEQQFSCQLQRSAENRQKASDPMQF
jgi:hypothetical protein